MTRVVVLAGGCPHAHDFAAVGAALADLVAAQGHDVDVVDHPDAAAARLDRAAALVVDALWWRMLGDAYDDWRDEWAYSPPPPTRAAVADFVGNGGGLLAAHTAAICFDDWPEWGDIVGGAWQWGVSSHPPLGRATATVSADHPVVDGMPTTFGVVDEVYGDLARRDDITVLAVARPDGTEVDTDQPVAWVHSYGRGRVVYSGFGHDAASIRSPGHAQLLRQGLAWVVGGR
jgi:hypothetical protein